MKAFFKKSFFITYFIPVICGAVFISASIFWINNKLNSFREQAEKMLRNETEVLIEAVSGIIQAQMHDGRINRKLLYAILGNVVSKTSVDFIKVEGKKRTFIEIGEPPESKDKETLYKGYLNENKFYLTKDIQLFRPPPPPGPADILKRPNPPPIHMMQIENDSDNINRPKPEEPEISFDFRGSRQVLTIGLDAASFEIQLKNERTNLIIIQSLTLASILIFVMVWIYLNINNRLKLELEKSKARNEKLEELGLAASGLAHEVKNPLSIIRGFAQKTLQCAHNPSEVFEFAEKIIDQADISTERLSDFINYAKRRPPSLEPVNAKKSIIEVIEMLRFELDEKNITIESELTDSIIISDREFLQQIVVNILLNSIQSCSNGNKIGISLKIKGETACLSISDNGKGIDKEFLKEIFKPYISAKSSGHGIGLAIVKKLAEELKWDITMSSEINKGTTTKITGIRLANEQ